ncbi:MAG: sugar ABC transporter permease [Ruthenibacterium sp.]
MPKTAKPATWQAQKKYTPWLLAAPVLGGLLVFFALPFCITIWYSFTFGVGGAEFVWLDNYGKVLSSAAFRLAAYNTLRFLAIAVPLIMVLGFALALLLQRKFAGTKLFRSVLLFPMVVPVASIVMVIQVFFASRGIVNTSLTTLGLPIVQWLDGPAAFWVLVGLYLWKNCGYNVILMLAGLNMIPSELYQSAAIEGANGWQKFRFITMPLICPSLFFVFVMSVINSFKTYREAFLLGGKHPHESIYMLQHFLNNNFENLNYQRLSVAAILLFSFIFVLVAVFYVVQKRFGEAAQ